MRSGDSSKSSEFIKTFVRLKPTLMDEISLINATKQEVLINRTSADSFEFSITALTKTKFSIRTAKTKRSSRQ